MNADAGFHLAMGEMIDRAHDLEAGQTRIDRVVIVGPQRLQNLLSARLGAPHWEHCRDDIREVRYAGSKTASPHYSCGAGIGRYFCCLARRQPKQFKVEG